MAGPESLQEKWISWVDSAGSDAFIPPHSPVSGAEEAPALPAVPEGEPPAEGDLDYPF